MWTCATCEDVNADEEAFCAVCGRARPVVAEPPTAAVPAPPPAPIVTHAPEPVPLPVPIEAPPVAAPVGSPGRRPRTGMLILLVALVAVLVAGAIGIPRLLRSADDDPAPVAATPVEPPPAPTEATTIPPEPTGEGPAGEPSPTAAGLVRIGPGVTGDRAAGVAAMFATYYGGINAKDYDQVGSVLDPAGSIDPADDGDMADLARGTRTTRDSDIVLNRLLDLGGAQIRAEVTFRSNQRSGDGPRGRTGETCTRWDIAYTLSFPPYKIVRSTASSAPC
jgi:hypothetical protein